MAGAGARAAQLADLAPGSGHHDQWYNPLPASLLGLCSAPSVSCTGLANTGILNVLLLYLKDQVGQT